MMSEEDSIAGGIYRSLGFAKTETLTDLYRPPTEPDSEEETS